MKKNLKKLLLVLVCLHAVTGFLHARKNPGPPTYKYPVYKTGVHSTCLGVRFDAFSIDKTSNNVYASNGSSSHYNKEIYRINTNGVCSKIVTIKGDKSHYYLEDILVDTTRKFIYILDDDNNYVPSLFKYTFTGKFIKKITIPNSDDDSEISSMAIDTKGNIYVVDKTQSLIHKFSTSGNLLLSWGGIGAFDGKFREPISLAIDKYNYIYVADSGNYRIQKFNSSGNFITKWGAKASTFQDYGIYEFRYITFVEVDKNLNVYVGDGQSRVKKFLRNGDYISTIKYKLNRHLNAHAKVDALGNIYTFDTYGSIKKYNKNLHLLDAWGRSYFPGYGRGEHANLVDMVFDSQNNMYTLDVEKSSVQKFSKSGKYIGQWGEYGNGIGQFQEIAKFGWAKYLCMKINSFDEIYVLASRNRVLKYDKGGHLLQTMSFSGNTYLESIAIDKVGNLYASEFLESSSSSDEYNVIIHVYNRYGKKIRTIQMPNLYSEHSSLEIDIDKKRNILYVNVSSASSSVLKCTLLGKVLTGWTVPASQQMVLKNGDLGYIQSYTDSPTFSIYSNSGVLKSKENLDKGSNMIKEDKFGNIYIGASTKIFKKSANPDIDHDGVINENDAFPFNPNEWLDTDHDGIGNNADKDDDNDGLSDALEKAHKLNPLNASDAQADFDHDGFSNAIEINAGTNIRSARSRPIWTPVMMGDIIMFIPAKK